jgi:hypothetical protein
LSVIPEFCAAKPVRVKSQMNAFMTTVVVAKAVGVHPNTIIPDIHRELITAEQ